MPALPARFGLLAVLWFLAPGCREVPLKNDPDSVAAPSFGLNSVPRQWEPELEEGDTTDRGSVKIAAEFGDDESDDSVDDSTEADRESAADESKSPTKQPSRTSKSASKSAKAKSGSTTPVQTLPEVDKAAQKELDEDFGPGD